MPLSRKMQTRIDRINLIMREKLSGIRVIRAFGTEDYEEKRFDGANKDLMNNAMKMMHAMSLLGPSLILILNLTVVGLLWRAGQGIGTEPVMPGDILAIIQYADHDVCHHAFHDFRHVSQMCCFSGPYL